MRLAGLKAPALPEVAVLILAAAAGLLIVALSLHRLFARVALSTVVLAFVVLGGAPAARPGAGSWSGAVAATLSRR